MRERPRFWLDAAALVAAMAAYLTGLAVATSPSRHAILDLLAVATLYLLLAVVCAGATLWARAVAWPLGLVASLAVGVVAAWHLREQTLFPHTIAAWSMLAVVFGVVWFLALQRVGVARRAAPLAAITLGAGALLALGLTGAYRSSDVLRWHLLRHHKLLGTPSYYAFATPVQELRAELWRSHPSGSVRAAEISERIDAASVHRNVVFVLIDTLRADSLAVYGGDPSLMPNLNRLASRSLVFENVSANASWTRPSVGSFFTGLLQEEHGATDRPYRLSPDASTLAERMQQRGFETAAFVANWAAVGRDAGFDQGFGEFEEVRGQGVPYARAETMSTAALRWLSAREAGGRPLFLYLHFLDPHTPYLSGGPPPVSHGDARQDYDAELRYVDGQLGRLIDRLPELLPGPTVLFVTSDHGEEFGEHGERGHGKSLYREVLWIPALLRVPDVEPGLVRTRLEARDFFWVLQRLALGESDLQNHWVVGRDPRRRYASIYSTTDSAPYRPYLQDVAMRSIEEDGYQLIWSGYGDTWELYDVQADPGQVVNLARRLPEKVRRLQGDLDGPVALWAKRVPIQTHEDTEDLLRALGYVR